MENDPKTPPEGTPPPVDEFKNFKAEMGRKLGNLEQTNATLLAQIQSMTSKVSPAAAGVDRKVSDIWFDKPEEAAQMIVDSATKQIKSEMAQQQAATQKQQATLAALVSEYPELNQGDSDLARRAVEIYNLLPDEEKSSPMAYRVAVKDAASELDVKPKSRRSAAANDDAAMGSSQRGPSRPPKKGEIDPSVEYLAEQFGHKLSPEAKERISKRHSRKSYSSWE